MKEELLHSLLLCRAGSFQRLGIPLAQVARLEKIPAASVEPAGGRAAVQYRQRILPLLDVSEMLGGVAASDPENLHVVVCRCAGAEFGLVVDEITDIVEEAIGDLYPAGRAGLLGSVVTGGRVTDLLDLEALARWGSVSSDDGLTRLRDALIEDAGSEVFDEVLA